MQRRIGNVHWGIAGLLGIGIVCFLFLLGKIEQIKEPQISPEVGPVARTS